MHKKFLSNPGFRYLVRPVMASGFDFDRRESFALNAMKENRITVEERKKGGCCK